MSAIANVETTAEIKFNANVRVDLEDSVYQVAVESCRLNVWSYNGLIKGSIDVEVKIFDETERNTATLKLSNSEFPLKNGRALLVYEASSDHVSIEDIATDSESMKSRLYDVIDDDLAFDIEVTGV